MSNVIDFSSGLIYDIFTKKGDIYDNYNWRRFKQIETFNWC